MRKVIPAVVMVAIFGLSGCKQEAKVDITALEERVSALEKKLDELNSKISSLEERVGKVEEVTLKKVTKPKIKTKRLKPAPPPKEKGR